MIDGVLRGSGRRFGWVLTAVLVILGMAVRTVVAQDLAGTWQGTVEGATGRADRAEDFKDGDTDKSALKAVLYRIDQDDYGRAASSISVQDGW